MSVSYQVGTELADGTIVGEPPTWGWFTTELLRCEGIIFCFGLYSEGTRVGGHYTSVVGYGESFTDVNSNGTWDTGEPFEDTNENGNYDENSVPMHDPAYDQDPQSQTGDDYYLVDTSGPLMTFTYFAEWYSDTFTVKVEGVIAISPVPEASAFLTWGGLVGLGLIGGWWRRRCRRG